MNFNEYVKILNRKLKDNNKDKIFICIGNSSISWDSIGPKVGTNLEKANKKISCIGSEKNNICSKYDLIKYYPKIQNKYIIAIDVAITGMYKKNDIYITNTAISIGSAFNISKGIIGNLSIKAALSNWQNIKKDEINYIAEFISQGIYEVMK